MYMAQLTQLNANMWTVDVNMVDYDVRGAVVIGEDYAVVWDTLTHPRDMAQVSQLIGDKPYYVVYSHADWDHIWGTAGLANDPLAIVAQAHCHERFSLDVPQTLSQMQADEPNRWDDVELVVPTLTFSQRMTLHLGGVTLELHHLAGHTQDCIVGWLPEMGILLGGDVMETPLPVVNDGDGVGAWLAELEAWARNDALKQTIPAHGTTDGRVCLECTIDYLRRLLSDADFPMPDNLDSFYQETHTRNLELVSDE
jgi:glyoxylase-like metal-dependent hydrolase (beta-lactamase superfamily II)